MFSIIGATVLRRRLQSTLSTVPVTSFHSTSSLFRPRPTANQNHTQRTSRPLSTRSTDTTDITDIADIADIFHPLHHALELPTSTHACNFCKRTFSSRVNVTRHIHGRNCSVANRVINTTDFPILAVAKAGRDTEEYQKMRLRKHQHKSGVHQHQKKHQKAANVGPITCNFCNVEFPSKNTFTKHLPGKNCHAANQVMVRRAGDDVLSKTDFWWIVKAGRDLLTYQQVMLADQQIIADNRSLKELIADQDITHQRLQERIITDTIPNSTTPPTNNKNTAHEPAVQTTTTTTTTSKSRTRHRSLKEMVADGDINDAWRLFYDLIQANEIGSQAPRSVEYFNVMCLACYNSEQMWELIDVTMKNAGVEPEVETINAYIHCLMVEGQYEQARRIVNEKMQKYSMYTTLRVQPNQRTEKMLNLSVLDLQNMR